MTSRHRTRFLTLINLIGYFDKQQADYYWNCIDDNDWSLITQSLLYEMETTLTDVTLETQTCSL